MSMMAPEPSGITRVAQNLTRILNLYNDLSDQATNHASSPLMPGGQAMVELGPVANLEAWGHMTSASERLGRAYTMPDLEDDDDEGSAFQRIEFWAERWRQAYGAEYDRRPSIASEAQFMRAMLNWAWDNEPLWDDMATDVQGAVFQLETVLVDGERSERGVPCMYDECRGKRLVRKLVPKRDEHGRKTWDYSDWHCPRCKRTWDEDAYWRNVKAANEKAKLEVIDGVQWCSVDYAARRVDRPESTIRVWVHRKIVATACIIVGRRSVFVSLDDVVKASEKGKRRRRSAA